MNDNTKSGIYKIVNAVNGKVYIGQSMNVKSRVQKHLSSLRRGDHHNMYLQRSFVKYGEGTFKFEIIKHCSVDDLDENEIKYIREYNSINEVFGYNLVDGGQKYRFFTEEVRERMGKSKRGKKISPEHRAKISKSNKGKKIQRESVLKANKTKEEKMISWGESNPNSLISNKMAETIIECFQVGMSCNQIVKKHKVSSETAYNILYNRTYKHILPEVREELIYANKRRQERKVNKAIELYHKGYSQNRISKKLKISRNTIRREINKGKIEVG